MRKISIGKLLIQKLNAITRALVKSLRVAARKSQDSLSLNLVLHPSKPITYQYKMRTNSAVLTVATKAIGSPTNKKEQNFGLNYIFSVQLVKVMHKNLIRHQNSKPNNIFKSYINS